MAYDATNIMAKSIIAQSFCIPHPTLTEENLPSQFGKVHIVTGCYSGVGHKLTSILYSKEAVVYVAGRSLSKAELSMSAIRGQYPSSRGRLEFLYVDLSDLTTIKKATQTFLAKEKRLDVLVNNAGVMDSPNGSKGKQGHELQMATNCLGLFLFTQGLMPLLSRTAKGQSPGTVRVIWASSIAANTLSPKGGVSMVNGEVQTFTDNQVNYGQSKAGNNYYAAEMHRRFGIEGILSLAFNPGNLHTELQRHANAAVRFGMKIGGYRAVYGAYTELFCGFSSDLTMENGGGYVVSLGRVGTDLLRNDVKNATMAAKNSEDGIATKFWEWSVKETIRYT